MLIINSELVWIAGLCVTLMIGLMLAL